MKESGGPSVIVAFDHAPLGLLPGLDRMDTLLREFAAQPLAGIIVNYGVLKRLSRENPQPSVNPIVRLDGNRTVLGGDWTRSAEWELFYRADACQQLGARAAVVNLLLGGPAELLSLKVVAQAVLACQNAGLPLLVSAMCLATTDTEEIGYSHQAFSARIAYEMGADMVNVYSAVDGAVIREVRQWCPLPLYAQGAPASEGAATLSRWARECVLAGAQGVVVGKSIWQHPDPTERLRVLITELARP